MKSREDMVKELTQKIQKPIYEQKLNKCNLSNVIKAYEHVPHYVLNLEICYGVVRISILHFPIHAPHANELNKMESGPFAELLADMNGTYTSIAERFCGYLFALDDADKARKEEEESRMRKQYEIQADVMSMGNRYRY